MAAEPDQESLVITVPGVPASLCDQAKALRRDVGYRDGRLATTLPDLFRRLGLVEITVGGFRLVWTDPDETFRLPEWPRMWRDTGVGTWSDEDIQTWERGIDLARRHGFVYAVTIFIVAGQRPY